MEDKNIALLIDADNVSSKYVKNIFDELATYGTVSIRRIYGNWQKPTGWNEDLLLEYSIQPIQQFDYTKGKNATDMAIVIDAMDILYTNNVQVFCIVTSDSDFTKLAMRIRESQAYVIGMGESKTPAALTRACNKFVHLDLIAADELKQDDVKTRKGDKICKSDDAESAVTTLSKIQDAIINMISEADEMPLGQVGMQLGKLFSDFDVRNYGYTKLSVMLREECRKILVENKDGIYLVTLKNDVDQDTVKNEIISFIIQNGGTVENLSKILDLLKTRHKHFELKDYGFSRLSSFLRSIDGIVVDGNKVKLKTTHR